MDGENQELLISWIGHVATDQGRYALEHGGYSINYMDGKWMPIREDACIGTRECMPFVFSAGACALGLRHTSTQVLCLDRWPQPAWWALNRGE